MTALFPFQCIRSGSCAFTSSYCGFFFALTLGDWKNELGKERNGSSCMHCTLSRWLQVATWHNLLNHMLILLDRSSDATFGFVVP